MSAAASPPIPRRLSSLPSSYTGARASNSGTSMPIRQSFSPAMRAASSPSAAATKASSNTVTPSLTVQTVNQIALKLAQQMSSAQDKETFDKSTTELLKAMDENFKLLEVPTLVTILAHSFRPAPFSIKSYLSEVRYGASKIYAKIVGQDKDSENYKIGQKAIKDFLALINQNPEQYLTIRSNTSKDIFKLFLQVIGSILVNAPTKMFNNFCVNTKTNLGNEAIYIYCVTIGKEWQKPFQ